MFIGSLLKKFSKNDEKRTIIREIIFRLTFDKNQEQLYLDSLDVLDDEYLDMFYKKLVALVEIIETKDIISINEIQNAHLKEKRKKEQQDSAQNSGNFNILFDNI